MRTLILANLGILFLVALGAAVYSVVWLVSFRKKRGLSAMNRQQLRTWARIYQIEPHRFETNRHLRARVRASMMPQRGRAAGIRSDLDSNRAARA